MNGAIRQARLFEVFVTLADTLTDEYDVIELLQILVDACVSSLNITAAGLLLADATGALEVVASTSEESRLIELLQLGADAGPCVEAFRTARPMAVEDIAQTRVRWPGFQRAALEQGFRSVTAIPMRLRQTTIGALNLFNREPGALDNEGFRLAKALADTATIGIIQEREAHEANDIRKQLQRTLDGRIVIEQAKGVLAYRHRESMDDAFKRLVAYARQNHVPVRDLAQQVVERTRVI